MGLGLHGHLHDSRGRLYEFHLSLFVCLFTVNFLLNYSIPLWTEERFIFHLPSCVLLTSASAKLCLETQLCSLAFYGVI